MNKYIAEVLFLRVGKIEKLNDNLLSAINKTNIKSSYLSNLGFKEDEQFDKKHHGGENKALLFFSLLTYQKIEKILDIKLDYEKFSPLGENILVSNIDENDICIGDILKLGEAKVQVTQPREPCKKLSLNSGHKDMLKTVYENGFTGWYAKVLENGIVKSSDGIELLQRDYPNLTISKLNQAMLNPKKSIDFIKESISCEVLGKPFKEALANKLK